MNTRLAHRCRKTPGRLVALLAFLFAAVWANAQEASPIIISPKVSVVNEQRQLILNFHVPEHCHIYADRLSVEIAGHAVNAILPTPFTELDKHSGKTREMYVKDFAASLPLISPAGDLPFAVNLQACNEAECYFPETRK